MSISILILDDLGRPFALLLVAGFGQSCGPWYDGQYCSCLSSPNIWSYWSCDEHVWKLLRQVNMVDEFLKLPTITLLFFQPNDKFTRRTYFSWVYHLLHSESCRISIKFNDPMGVWFWITILYYLGCIFIIDMINTYYYIYAPPSFCEEGVTSNLCD